MLKHRCPWCGEKIPLNLLKPSDLISRLARKEEDRTCVNCKKMYKQAVKKNFSQFVLTVIIIIAIFSLDFVLALIFPKFNNSLFIDLSYILLAVIALVSLLRIPYIRDYEEKEDKSSAVFLGVFFLMILLFLILDNQKKTIIFIGLFVIAMASILIYVYKEYTSIKKEDKSVSKTSVNVSIEWFNNKNGGLISPRFRVLNGEIFPACFLDSNSTPISKALCVALEDLKWKDLHNCDCTINLVLDDVSEKDLFITNNKFYLYNDYQKIAQGEIK